MKAWPHLIYSNLTQNPPYSIPRWVDDLASSFVTAIFQTSKTCDFFILVNLGIYRDRDVQPILPVTAKISSDGVTASNYLIPRWVDNLASSFVTAVLQTSKSRAFLIPVNLGIFQNRDIQPKSVVTVWPHLIYSNLTQNPPYSIPRWVDDLASSFVTAICLIYNYVHFRPKTNTYLLLHHSFIHSATT